jgi:hypothetical protein
MALMVLHTQGHISIPWTDMVIFGTKCLPIILELNQSFKFLTQFPDDLWSPQAERYIQTDNPFWYFQIFRRGSPTCEKPRASSFRSASVSLCRPHVCAHNPASTGSIFLKIIVRGFTKISRKNSRLVKNRIKITGLHLKA